MVNYMPPDPDKPTPPNPAPIVQQPDQDDEPRPPVGKLLIAAVLALVFMSVVTRGGDQGTTTTEHPPAPSLSTSPTPPVSTGKAPTQDQIDKAGKEELALIMEGDLVAANEHLDRFIAPYECLWGVRLLEHYPSARSLGGVFDSQLRYYNSDNPDTTNVSTVQTARHPNGTWTGIMIFGAC